MFKQDEAREFDVAGKAVRCQFCNEAKFWKKKAQLNTAVMTFFDMDWANPEATCLICDDCGYVHWFLELPRGARV